MIAEYQKQNLPLFIILSLGIHIIGYALFSVFMPKIQTLPKTDLQVSIITSSAGSPIAEPTVASTTPITPPSPPQKTAPVKKQVVPVEKQARPKPTPKAIPNTPKVASKPAPTPSPQKATTTQANPPKPVPTKAPSQPVEEDTLSQELDNLLASKKNTSPSNDQLSDATWSGAPRKTLSFPNIAAYIPQQYRVKGYGFSVTAKITFNPQGWVSSIELLNASGDPRIDSVFRTELRKIRIEPSKKNSFDTITKTFSITIK